MPVAARRFVCGLLAALGFMMMVPLVVNLRRIQTELLGNSIAIGNALDPAFAARLQSLMSLFLAGIAVATGFLYAALSAGHPKAWRPREDGTPRCARCDAELGFGLPRCPTCDQQLVW